MNFTEQINIALIAGIFSILGMIILPIVNSIISFFKQRRQGVTEKFLKRKTILEEKIKALGQHLDCSRVNVSLLHNGGNYYTGESVKRFSMVSEYVNKNSKHAILEVQGVLMAPYLRILNKLFKEKYVFEPDTQLKSDLLSRINYEYNIKSSLTIGIFRKKPFWMFWKEQKRMVAFINIGWDEIKESINNQDLELVLSYKNNIYNDLIELSKEL
jgi:hypothetical protein